MIKRVPQISHFGTVRTKPLGLGVGVQRETYEKKREKQNPVLGEPVLSRNNCAKTIAQSSWWRQAQDKSCHAHRFGVRQSRGAVGDGGGCIAVSPRIAQVRSF